MFKPTIFSSSLHKRPAGPVHRILQGWREEHDWFIMMQLCKKRSHLCPLHTLSLCLSLGVSLILLIAVVFFCWQRSRSIPHTHSRWSFPEWNSVTPRWDLGWGTNRPSRVWPRRMTILEAVCVLPIHENLIVENLSIGCLYDQRYLENVIVRECSE